MKLHHSLPSLLLLSSVFTMLPFHSQADSASPSPYQPQSASTSSLNTNDLQNIDQQIESLEKQLARLRKNMLNSEIHAQNYMIDNWHEFAEDINRTEENEQVIQDVKKKLQDLKTQKQLLLKDKTYSPK